MPARKLQNQIPASGGQNYSRPNLRAVKESHVSNLEDIYKEDINLENDARRENEIKTKLAQKNPEEELAPVIPLHTETQKQETPEKQAWLNKLAAFLKNHSNGTLGRLGKLLEGLLENRGDIRTKSVIYANLLAVFGNTFTAVTQLLPSSFKFLKKLGGFTGESFRASTFINAMGSALIGRNQKDATYTAAQIGDATQALGDREETYFNRAKFIGAYNAADYGKQILQNEKVEGAESNTTGNGEYESYGHGLLSMLKIPQVILSKISKKGINSTFRDQNIRGFLMNVALMFTPGVKLLTRNSKSLSSWLPYLYRNGLSLLGEIAGFSKENANKPMWRIARLGFFISTIFAQLAKTPGMPEWAKHVFSSVNFAMDSGCKIVAMESRNKGEISNNPHHKELNIFDSFKYTMNTMLSTLTGKNKADAPVIPIETAQAAEAPIIPIEAAQEILAQQAEEQLSEAAQRSTNIRRTPVLNRYFVNPSNVSTTPSTTRAKSSNFAKPSNSRTSFFNNKPQNKRSVHSGEDNSGKRAG